MWAVCKGSHTAVQGAGGPVGKGEAVPGHGVLAGTTRSRQVWVLYSNASEEAGVMEMQKRLRAQPLLCLA